MSFINYLEDTQKEMKHVTWPTARNVVLSTLLVIAISVATSLFLGVFDFGFSRGLQALLTAQPALSEESVASATSTQDVLNIEGDNLENATINILPIESEVDTPVDTNGTAP